MKVTVKKNKTMRFRDVEPGQAFVMMGTEGAFLKIDPHNLGSFGVSDNARCRPVALWLNTYPASLCNIAQDTQVEIVNATIEL